MSEEEAFSHQVVFSAGACTPRMSPLRHYYHLAFFFFLSFFVTQRLETNCFLGCQTLGLKEKKRRLYLYCLHMSSLVGP